MTKGNLFNAAKTKAAKTTDKKNDKLIVHVKGDETDIALVKMVELETQIDQLTAELEVAKGIVKEAAFKAFIDIYAKNGEYPGSFIVTTDSGANIMSIPMDKYLKCDENRFNELKDTYGDDVVTEKTEFVLNASLVDKYGEVLSNMIENSTDISDDDKAELIQARVAYSVSKGAIEKAFTWGKGKVNDFIRDIQPIFATKGAKVK
jgi:hypothetical protein